MALAGGDERVARVALYEFRPRSRRPGRRCWSGRPGAPRGVRRGLSWCARRAHARAPDRRRARLRSTRRAAARRAMRGSRRCPPPPSPHAPPAQTPACSPRSPPRAGRETGPAMTRCPAALRVRDRRRELRPSPHTRRSRWRLRSARRPPTPRPPGNRWRPQGARTRGGCRAGASNSLLSAANWSVAAKSTSAEGAPAGDTLTCTSVVAQPALRVSHKANAGRVGATRAVIADYQSREAIGHPDRVIVIEHRSRGACIGPVQSGEHA